MMMPSWTGYLLSRERLSRQDREILDRTKAFHVGPNGIKERMFVCVDRELSAPEGD